MTYWRVDLSDRPILRIDAIPGRPALVAAWLTPSHIKFFELQNGTFWGDLYLGAAPGGSWLDAGWASYVAALAAPNGAVLPWASVADTEVLSSIDGRLRLYHSPARSVALENDGIQYPLAMGTDVPAQAVSLDRELGTVWVMAANGDLHVFQQNLFVGTFGMCASASDVVALLAADSHDSVTVVEGQHMRAIDMAGQVVAEYRPAEPLSAATCAAGDAWIVVAQRDSGRIQVLNAMLETVYQQSVDFLLRHTVSIQLFSRALHRAAPVSALAAFDSGEIAFGLDGALCVVSLNLFAVVPWTRPLF